MATAEQPVRTADDRAWDLFFEALDTDSPSAARIPPGAPIIAADAPNRDELVRSYHADRRTVVVVHEDGGEETLRPNLARANPGGRPVSRTRYGQHPSNRPRFRGGGRARCPESPAR